MGTASSLTCTQPRRRVVHFTLGIGKPWHWFATWLVVDLMPLWTDLRERLPPTPGGLRRGDCAGHAARRAILFPAPFVIVGLLVHRLFLRWGCIARLLQRIA
jgi:hypothetical protein